MSLWSTQLPCHKGSYTNATMPCLFTKLAAGIVRFHHVAGNKNPADVVSKHWDFLSVKPLLRPLLFWEGDTAKIKAYDLAKHGEPKVPKLRKTIHDEVDL